MKDQAILENLLLIQKGLCTLYLHAAVEAATPRVRRAFRGALDEALDNQAAIYDLMAEQGWYPVQQADAEQIAQLKSKYGPC